MRKNVCVLILLLLASMTFAVGVWSIEFDGDDPFDEDERIIIYYSNEESYLLSFEIHGEDVWAMVFDENVFTDGEHDVALRLDRGEILNGGGIAFSESLYCFIIGLETFQDFTYGDELYIKVDGKIFMADFYEMRYKDKVFLRGL